MGKFLVRRLVNYVVLVFLATSFAYLLAATALSPRANYADVSPRPSEAELDQRLDRLNLNDKTPVFERYTTWVSGVAQADFGLSVKGTSINEEMQRRVGVSLRLIILGTTIGAISGVLIGAYGAVRQYRAFDRVSTGAAFFILSVPAVVIAVSLQVIAVSINEATGTSLFQYAGEYSSGVDGFWPMLFNRIQHAILPTLSLAIGQFAAFSRYQRNMMLDVLGADFVRTAMAKGLTRRRALFKHALRTALIPTITYFTFVFGSLMAGTTFTEKIYGWNGMGSWVIDSITRNDVHAVAAVSCFMAVCIMVASFLSDIFYAWLDPRVRVS